MNLEDIIKGCKKNNSKAQGELYRLYKDVLFVLCLKYCRDEAEAEDVLHNAFIKIFTKINSFKNVGSFEGWLKRITINIAIDSYKKNTKLLPIKDDYIEDTYLTEEEADQLSPDYILTLIQQLPDQYRLTFSLYELDNYSHKEIAEMLTISESTSKSNLHRAKVILKEKIRRTDSTYNTIVSNGK